MMMKTAMLLPVVFALSVPAFAGEVDGRGREWLDQHKDAPKINVTGTWDSPDWGIFVLNQAEGGREVTGTDRKYQLTGVVSGNSLYLLFSKGGNGVNFCATLTSDSDTSLIGSYSYKVTRLKLGHGLCQNKSYKLRMTKKSADSNLEKQKK